MFKILVLEDDENLNKAVCSFLRQNGYEATGFLFAAKAFHAMEKIMFDLIITDIMMPGIDGLEVVKAVRATDEEIPILLMTARDDLPSKQLSYQVGIDDYMVKPIDLDELVLRVGALLRRAKIARSRRLEIGDLTLDISEYTAVYQGQNIPLTVREFNIIYKLLSFPGRTFTRIQLMDEFWSVDTNTAPRAVDVYMTKLRSKFENCKEFEILTVHGLGYKAVVRQK